jgi:hypothetical protein
MHYLGLISLGNSSVRRIERSVERLAGSSQAFREWSCALFSRCGEWRRVGAWKSVSHVGRAIIGVTTRNLSLTADEPRPMLVSEEKERERERNTSTKLNGMPVPHSLHRLHR